MHERAPRIELASQWDFEKTAVLTVITCAEVVSSMRCAACWHVRRQSFNSAQFTSALHHTIKHLFDDWITYDHLFHFVVIIGMLYWSFTNVLCTCMKINQRRWCLWNKKPVIATINHSQFCRVVSMKAFIFATRTEVKGRESRYEWNWG